MANHLRTLMANQPSVGSNGGDTAHNFCRDIRDDRWSPIYNITISDTAHNSTALQFFPTLPSRLSSGNSELTVNYIILSDPTDHSELQFFPTLPSRLPSGITDPPTDPSIDHQQITIDRYIHPLRPF